jgi:hypothetical protein
LIQVAPTPPPSFSVFANRNQMYINHDTFWKRIFISKRKIDMRCGNLIFTRLCVRVAPHCYLPAPTASSVKLICTSVRKNWHISIE